MKSSNIGGQAVLEGIMMKNGPKYAVAVRKPDGDIEIKVDEYNKGVKSVLHITIVSMMAAYNIVLADKYGWDGDQLSEINAKVDDQFKSINEDYNTLDELIEAVHQEYGILFE